MVTCWDFALFVFPVEHECVEGTFDLFRGFHLGMAIVRIHLLRTLVDRNMTIPLALDLSEEVVGIDSMVMEIPRTIYRRGDVR